MSQDGSDLRSGASSAIRWLWLLLLTLMSPALADQVEDCIAESVLRASDTTTVGELRARCRNQNATSTPSSIQSATGETSAIQRRFSSEFDTMDRSYTLTAHRVCKGLVSPAGKCRRR